MEMESLSLYGAVSLLHVNHLPASRGAVLTCTAQQADNPVRSAVVCNPLPAEAAVGKDDRVCMVVMISCCHHDVSPCCINTAAKQVHNPFISALPRPHTIGPCSIIGGNVGAVTASAFLVVVCRASNSSGKDQRQRC